MALDVYQIHSDLFDLIKAGPSAGWSVEKAQDNPTVYFEAHDRSKTLDNMPMIDVQLGESDIEERAIPTGEYAVLNFSIDIVTYDLNSNQEAARIRSLLVNDVMDLLKANRQFSSQINTIRISPTIAFGQGSTEGANIAGGLMFATLSLIVDVYIE